MRQRFPRKRRETRADKIFKTTAKDVAIAFVFKTIVPLIPLVLIVYAVSYVVNLELTGEYAGLAQGLGRLKLSLRENKDELGGTMVLRRDEHYQIVDGKMLDDKRMEIHLSKANRSDVAAVNDAKAEEAKSAHENSRVNSKEKPESGAEAKTHVDSDSKIEGALVDNPAAAATADATIDARKEQNDIRGTLQIGGATSNFTLTRSSFTALLGKCWINRALDYLGIKVKV